VASVFKHLVNQGPVYAQRKVVVFALLFDGHSVALEGYFGQVCGVVVFPPRPSVIVPQEPVKGDVLFFKQFEVVFEQMVRERKFFVLNGLQELVISTVHVVEDPVVEEGDLG
jgi:hypothetical protein